MVSLMGITSELPQNSHHSGMLHSPLCTVFKKPESCICSCEQITFLLSCWFSFSSSTNFRLLSLEVKEASLSSWIVFCKLWLSFSSFSIRLEAHSFSSNTKDFLAVETWEAEGGTNQFTNVSFWGAQDPLGWRLLLSVLQFQIDC